MKKVLLVLVAVGFVIGITFAITKRYYPTVVPELVIEYVDRDIGRIDTVTISRPVVRTIFRTVTDTIHIEVPVPVDFRPVGVIAPHPIRFDGSEVVLTYFQTDSVRFYQDRYVIPKRKTEWWLAPYAGWNPFNPKALTEFGFETAFRYKNVIFYSRIFTMEAESIFTTVGLRVNLLHSK